MAKAALSAAQHRVGVCTNTASGYFLIIDTNRRADVALDIVKSYFCFSFGGLSKLCVECSTALRKTLSGP